MRALVAAVLMALIAMPALAEPGRLVIAGGALERGNAAVWKAFIEGLPNPDTDRIAVIASASGEPGAAFDSARAALMIHGVTNDRVFLVQAAVIDDPGTEVDESQWSRGGYDLDQVALVATAGAVWFTGGDQVRTARVLLDDTGAASPMLRTLHQRLDQGAVIGGSSAGAAIQSEVMILRGDGLTALMEAPGRPGPDATMEDGRLIVGRGAGFFRYGVIDQHFDRQARLGRLARATVTSDARFGFGIDENTALIVDLATDTATVAGAGTVTILDNGSAKLTPGQAFQAEGIALAIASAGDTIALPTGVVTPASFKINDMMTTARASQSTTVGQGAALPARRLDEILADDLIENPATSLELLSFNASGAGMRFDFVETNSTRGFSGRDVDGPRINTISGLRFSITPGVVTFQAVAP